MGDKVLLVDTGFSAQPIYEAIRGLGYEAHVVGGRPDDALAKSADKYWELDYSDTQKLRQLITKEGYKHIVPGCTDRSYSSCADVAQTGRFTGIESTENDAWINRKDKFRSMSEKLGLSVPNVIKQFNSDSYPLIVKPVDAFSGNGITIVRDETQLDDAIALARAVSPTGQYVCEDYIDGQLYSHSAFICDGRVVKDFIVREDSTACPFAVDLSMVVTDYPEQHLAVLREVVVVISAHLELKDGLLHTQFMQSGDQLNLIELTRRCPGDLYSSLIELQTGFSYAENYVRPFLGMELKPSSKDGHKSLIIRHTFSSMREQRFTSLSYYSALQMEKWVPLLTTGDLLKQSPKGRVGIGFVCCPSAAEQKNIYNKFLQRKAYRIC